MLIQENNESKFVSEIEFEEWWYRQPATYRYHLGRDDAVIIAKLLSDHETTLSGAAILLKSPASLRYVEPDIYQALERETAIRQETYGKFIMGISTGYPQYDALLCLKEVLKTNSVDDSNCWLIAMYEEEFLSK